jgi:hypothetical protein
MNVRELLLVGLVGWTGLGIVGVLISLARRERAKVRKGWMWLVGVWVVYVAVVLGVSMAQPERVVAMGQEQCFDVMCFGVMGVDEVAQFVGRGDAKDDSRLVRVTVRVRNTGRARAQSETLIRAYLVDGQGRRWRESSGVSGNQLTGRVVAGGEMISTPMFKVPADATGLRLVFTHGRWQPGVLVIGDSDSLGHRRTVVELGR